MLSARFLAAAPLRQALHQQQRRLMMTDTVSNLTPTQLEARGGGGPLSNVVNVSIFPPQLKESIRRFADEQLAPHAAAIDRDNGWTGLRVSGREGDGVTGGTGRHIGRSTGETR
jgi:hypothetical protein